MTPGSPSAADRVRALHSRKLDFASYARELLAVAGLPENEVRDSEARAERLMALRSRLRELEARLREIESVK